MKSLADDLRVGSLAYFVRILVERWKAKNPGKDLVDAVKAAGILPRTLERISSGEVRKPRVATLKRLASLLACGPGEEQEILDEARRMMAEI